MGVAHCAWMCAGVHRPVWVHMGVHRCELDEFSEYLLETRV